MSLNAGLLLGILLSFSLGGSVEKTNVPKLRAMISKNSVNPEAVKYIESSFNPLAVNKKTDAVGWGQITPIALRDYNQMNPRDTYTRQQLFDPQINSKIMTWMIDERLPQQLQAYGVTPTPEKIIWAYHDGSKNVANGYMSDNARNYLIKYRELLKKK